MSSNSVLKERIDPSISAAEIVNGSRLTSDVVRILLIDDHMLLRGGLRALLELEQDLEIVGEAESAAEACELAKAVQPQLIITDIAMPGESGLSVIPALKALIPGVRVLVLSAHCTNEYVHAALKVGADGYIVKDASRDELLEGIRAVLDDRQYFSSVVTNHIVAGFLSKSDTRSPNAPPITQREKEVLKLIAMAYTTKNIATRLKLTVKTVEKHRSNMMRKLGLQNAAAVTLYAVRHNLVSEDFVNNSET